MAGSPVDTGSDTSARLVDALHMLRSPPDSMNARPVGERLWLSDGLTELWRGHAAESGRPGLLRLIRPGLSPQAQREAEEFLRSEYAALTSLRTSAVPRLLAASPLDEGRSSEAWLWMSPADGTVLGDLMAATPSHSAGRIAWWLRLATQLLVDLRAAGVEHGGIEPDRIVLTRQHTFVLVDFTRSTRLPHLAEESSDERAVRHLGAWLATGDRAEADRLVAVSSVDVITRVLAAARPDLSIDWLRQLAALIAQPDDPAAFRSERLVRTIALELQTFPIRTAA